MITPVKSISVQFTADGTSDVAKFDLSTLPLGLDFGGAQSIGVQSLAVTNGIGPVAGVAAGISGSILTLTFNAPPPELDGGAALIIYTATMFLQFASLPVS